MTPPDTSRRDFLKYLGAAAGLHAAACIRKPKEHILPYAKRPEDLVPGDPRYYATAWNVGDSVQGLIVRSTDGRPTKVEGNPRHPMSRGGTNAWAQASVLALYAPERTRTAMQDGKAMDAPGVATVLAGFVKQAGDGEGLAVLLDEQPSPTLHRLLAELQAKFPKARFYQHDGAGEEHARSGAALAGIEGASWSIAGSPRVIAAFDADPLATEGDTVAFNRLFAEGRRPDPQTMSRLYAAEPSLSLTGANADHRLALSGSRIGDLLAAVASHLKLSSLPSPAELRDLPFVKVLAEDLRAARGTSLVLVGERQPAQVHALGHVINEGLGNFGQTLKFVRRKRTSTGSLTDLAERLRSKSVKQLLILGGNPVFDAPAGLELAELIGQVPVSIHLGLHLDETGARCTTHLPKAHYLEAWGDLLARDGTLSIQQPLIAPLYPASISGIELLALLLGRKESGYDLTRETHKALGGLGFEKSWQQWLHDGVVGDAKAEPVTPQVSAEKLKAAWKPGADAENLELAFVRDASVLDGRFAGSPWLQELPDPVTKLTWDNAALIAPATAARLGLASGTVASIKHGEKELRIAVWVQPGTAENVVALPLGYGRTRAYGTAKSGFDVGPLRASGSPFILTGATATATSATYPFSTTQPEASEHGRNLIRQAEMEEYVKNPKFVEEAEVVEPDMVQSLLWKEPGAKDGHQWGMAIDLNSCTACGACTIACQAENNIPWVGKDEVAHGRVMHWMRIDRYLEEAPGTPSYKAQPIGCAHCETAPCETVCPVAATSHSPEGLNDMAYNRCIGTRYCANNCPYKVRRFNFYNYTSRNDEEYGLGIAMQRNPDVTVRFRGVMEKCTYCVQKINRARIESKVRGDLVIKDGTVTPSCAAACPTQAITFGDLNDKESRVSKLKESPRNYSLLAELNVRPRTTFLAKVTNPNPKLGKG